MLRAAHAHGHYAMHAFAVPHNHLRQLKADVIEGGLKGLHIARPGPPTPGAQGRVFRQTVGQQQHGVVGAHVAVHGDAIKAAGHRFRARRNVRASTAASVVRNTLGVQRRRGGANPSPG